jgi:hypothetical protein
MTGPPFRVIVLVVDEIAGYGSIRIDFPGPDDGFRRDTVFGSELTRDAIHPTTGCLLRLSDFTREWGHDFWCGRIGGHFDSLMVSC